MKRLIIEPGEKFGDWTFIEFIEGHKGSRKARCKCKCGSVQEVYVCHIKRGLSTKCKRCYIVKHDMHNTPTYKSWVSMMSRCYSQQHKSYATYGARGIKVCDQWHDFKGFFADMGERPKGKTLDRIDVNGDYTKDSCRWATPREQQNNTRTNRHVDYDGKSYTVAELARHLGIKYDTLIQRVDAGTRLDRPVGGRI